MIFTAKPIPVLLAIALLTVSSFSSCDKEEFAKPENLVNTIWDCNEPPLGFENYWGNFGDRKLKRFVFRSTTKADYWIVIESFGEFEYSMTYEISKKDITLYFDDGDLDDLKWTGSISGNKMSMTAKGSHLPNGEIGPFIFVKQ